MKRVVLAIAAAVLASACFLDVDLDRNAPRTPSPDGGFVIDAGIDAGAPLPDAIPAADGPVSDAGP